MASLTVNGTIRGHLEMVVNDIARTQAAWSFPARRLPVPDSRISEIFGVRPDHRAIRVLLDLQGVTQTENNLTKCKTILHTVLYMY